MDPKHAYSPFVYHWLRSEFAKKQIAIHLSRAAQPNLFIGSIGQLRAPLPPFPEQRAIAEALGDVDGLLRGLERLIAKKRDLKQAAMQQLLTAQTRLPGFSGGWEVLRFSELCFLRKDRVDPRLMGASDFCVELEHIGQGTGQLIGSTSTTSSSSQKSVFRKGDVLFGKLRAYLRKYWMASRDGVCSTEVWVLAPREDRLVSEYLYQIVTQNEFVEAACVAFGTHMPRADWDVVKVLEVSLPAIAEQTAIAAVLSDMDAEIAALEQRRDKTRSLKQAMMQELLTGRTRLV